AAPTGGRMCSSAFPPSNKCSSCSPCVGPASSSTYSLSLHDALPICFCVSPRACPGGGTGAAKACTTDADCAANDVAGSRCISSCCGENGTGRGSCVAPCSRRSHAVAPTGNTQGG